MDFKLFRSRRSRDQESQDSKGTRELDSLKAYNEHLEIKMRGETERFKLILNASLELANERDTSKLCDKVLTIIRSLCAAEGASLYLADNDEHVLWFSHVQNEKIQMETQHFKLPIDDSSMAGACAIRKKIIHVADVYQIPEGETFKFNQSFDKRASYRTTSILCVPILKSTEELVGVIQLINSKRNSGYTQEDIEIAKGLSAHIAVALETALLYQNIEQLFEGFIKASVTAIESRDPTTSGHSERVAKLTVRLAEEVSDCQQPEFKDKTFNRDELKQLRYASLLHDFGKIGVPEPILLKEKKLFKEELRDIELRLKLLRLSQPERAGEFEQLWKEILSANEPSVVFEKAKSDLSKYVDQFAQVLGENIPLLTSDEWKRLSISKGSLTQDDRLQIESHVIHTFKFLEKIPWTGNLTRVPEIAKSHHEKLDGTGYPLGLKQEKIPFESQIMAITDIWDALTAADRPYKKSVPRDRAILILKEDASKGKINSELVRLFEEKRVFEIS